MILVSVANCCATLFSYVLATGKSGQERCAALSTASRTPKRYRQYAIGLGRDVPGVAVVSGCGIASARHPVAACCPEIYFHIIVRLVPTAEIKFESRAIVCCAAAHAGFFVTTYLVSFGCDTVTCALRLSHVI